MKVLFLYLEQLTLPITTYGSTLYRYLNCKAPQGVLSDNAGRKKNNMNDEIHTYKTWWLKITKMQKPKVRSFVINNGAQTSSSHTWFTWNLSSSTLQKHAEVGIWMWSLKEKPIVQNNIDLRWRAEKNVIFSEVKINKWINTWKPLSERSVWLTLSGPEWFSFTDAVQ